MAAIEKNLITCVEFGTHSIRVLHGTRDKAGNPVVLGVGQAPSDGAVCKGEIIQAKQAAAALDFEQAARLRDTIAKLKK